MDQTALKQIEGPAKSRPQKGVAGRRWKASLLFIVMATIAVRDISQATDSIALTSHGQIVFSLLFAAIALSAQRRSQMQIKQMPKAQGSRVVEAFDATVREYTPDIVTRHVHSGDQLTSCEREISVLFADIRGFTSFCEHRTPAEIFRTVSQFTERICQIIRVHGGHVIEFNGDGIMAVFGAPNPIVAKERAAVQAGCDILEAMKSMATDSSSPRSHLSVGVGIATGTDFVGHIQAHRAIWTALGNTTNLAARLQNLTRDFHVAMAIDAATRAAVEPCTMIFEQRRVAIRGRHDAQDVHFLDWPSRHTATSSPTLAAM